MKAISVELPRGVASEALEHMGEREDLLGDVALSLSYLEEVLRGGEVRGADAELAALLGLIHAGITVKQDAGELPLREVRNGLRKALAAAYQREQGQC